MTIQEIKELIQVLQDTGIAELEVQRGDNRVKITRVKPGAQEVMVPTMLPVSVATAAPLAPQALPQFMPNSGPFNASGHQLSSPDDEMASDIPVKSPIVGTYYDAPSPGEPPFVKIGDRVEPKQVLCIIESMKLMNEIEAEVAGTLVAKLVENGRPVEYGESLFTIRPLATS